MSPLHFVVQYTYRTVCGIKTSDRAAYPHVNVLHDTYFPQPLCPVCAEAVGIDAPALGQMELL